VGFIMAFAEGNAGPLVTDSGRPLESEIEMPTKTKTLHVTGLLRSVDGKLKRDCKVKVNRNDMFVEGLDGPAKATYSEFSVTDSDNFPKGDYEVEYEGQKELLTKDERGPGYYARRRKKS